jgi:hypothetical protein
METSDVTEESSVKHSVYKVTSFSKFFALTIFIALPFLGGWVGYEYGYLNSSTVDITTPSGGSFTSQFPTYLDGNHFKISDPKNIGGNFFIANKKVVYAKDQFTDYSSAPNMFPVLEIEGADAESAEVVYEFVIKDRRAVYTNCSGRYEPIKLDYGGIIVKSFEIIEWPYFKDELSVYYFDTPFDRSAICKVVRVENADPNTFENSRGIKRVCDWYMVGDTLPYRPRYYAKDLNHVYCGAAIVESASPAKCTDEDFTDCAEKPHPDPNSLI